MNANRIARRNGGRAQRIAAWLASPVAECAVELALEVLSSDDGGVMGRWPKSDVTADLALSIDRLVTDLAEETGTRIDAKLCWYTSDGKLWTYFSLRAEPSEGVTEFTGKNSAESEVQRLRHHEAMAELYVEAHGATLNTLRQANESLQTTVDELRTDKRKLEQEKTELKERLIELEGIANEAVAQAEEAAKAQAGESQDATVLKLIATGLSKPVEAK